MPGCVTPTPPLVQCHINMLCSMQKLAHAASEQLFVAELLRHIGGETARARRGPCGTSAAGSLQSVTVQGSWATGAASIRARHHRPPRAMLARRASGSVVRTPRFRRSYSTALAQWNTLGAGFELQPTLAGGTLLLRPLAAADLEPLYRCLLRSMTRLSGDPFCIGIPHCCDCSSRQVLRDSLERRSVSRLSPALL